MNYLVHALPFFEEPYFAAATGVPDWLTVVDRRVRVRGKHVEPFLGDGDSLLAAVAGGVSQHLRDDAQFHGTRAFFEVSGKISDLSRVVLDVDRSLHPRPLSPTLREPQRERGGSMQASFLGHVLCEVLLDAVLIEEDQQRVKDYYGVLDAVDPAAIEAAVNRISPRAVDHLAYFIGEFRRARILWDYLEDSKLMIRLNQVMRRVGLPLLPESFARIFPEARRVVAERKGELLGGVPVV